MKQTFVRQCQISYVRKLNRQFTGSRRTRDVFRAVLSRLIQLSNTIRAVIVFSKSCLKPWMNIFGQDTFPRNGGNDHSLLVLHPSSEKFRCMCMSVMTWNITRVRRGGDSLVHTAKSRVSSESDRSAPGSEIKQSHMWPQLGDLPRQGKATQFLVGGSLHGVRPNWPKSLFRS
jgi:hypothetical protein